MKTNIATTKDQSARLLRCGVPTDTADMHWHGAIVPRGGSLTSMPEPSEEWDLWATPYSCMPEELQAAKLMEDYTEIVPAWSLSALLGLLPNPITFNGRSAIIGLYHEEEKNGGGWNCSYLGIKFFREKTPFEAIIKMIEWLTENNYKLNEIN